MAKNKLLTIPIEEDKRERLNQYCGDRGKTVSQMITGFIDKLLDGSIDPLASIEPSRPPIEVNTDAIVEEVVAKLKDTHYIPAKEFNRIISDISLDMANIKNDLWLMNHAVKNVREFVKFVDVEPTDSSTVAKSINVTDQPPEPYTLEDTKTYLKDKCDYNRTRERRSDRISQPDIATHLLTYGYPHPSNKKWNRDEVRAVCKLWELHM